MGGLSSLKTGEKWIMRSKPPQWERMKETKEKETKQRGKEKAACPNSNNVQLLFQLSCIKMIDWSQH